MAYAIIIEQEEVGIEEEKKEMKNCCEYIKRSMCIRSSLKYY